jgi:hypothetical protein
MRNNSIVFFFIYHLSHLWEGLPQLAYFAVNFYKIIAVRNIAGRKALEYSRWIKKYVFSIYPLLWLW